MKDRVWPEAQSLGLERGAQFRAIPPLAGRDEPKRHDSLLGRFRRSTLHRISRWRFLRLLRMNWRNFVALQRLRVHPRRTMVIVLLVDVRDRVLFLIRNLVESARDLGLGLGREGRLDRVTAVDADK